MPFPLPATVEENHAAQLNFEALMLAHDFAALSYVTPTGNYRARNGDWVGTSGGVTITAPRPDINTHFALHNSGSGLTTVQAYATDTFYGPSAWAVSSVTVPVVAGASLGYAAFQSNGKDWVIVGGGVSSGWITPTLLGAFVSAGNAPQYWKDSLGFVHLRGNTQSGLSGSVAFVLGAGYRPGQSDFWPILQSGGVAGAYIQINSNGNVNVTFTAAVAYFNGVTFLAEN